MAKIMTVDYEAFPAIAASMRSHAVELNNEFTAAYKNIEEMHNSWYGKRYNELAKDFNNLAPTVNELLDLVVTNIPFTLETVANNYAMADTGSAVCRAEQTPANKMQELNMPNDVGMKFVTEEVNSVQQSVSSNFDKAKSELDNIATDFTKFVWESEAADAFKARFTQLKSQVESSIENIKANFTKLMNQTKEDIQNTENANTVQ